VKELIAIPGRDPAAAGLIEFGIFPSLPAKQQRLWDNASNVRFGDRGAEKAKGISALASVAGNVSGMAQAFVEGKQRVYLGTATTFYRYQDGDTITLGDTFTSGRWSIIPWGEWVLAVNGVDPVQVDKDTGTMVPLAGVPVTTARIIRKLAQRPIIFNGQDAYWPRATDIEYWTTPDPTGRAGSMFIRDLDSDVVAVEPLGEFLAYYTKNKMGLISFIGGQDVYGFKNRLEGIGAIGLNAVIPVGQKHWGLSANGIWLTDGSGFQYMDAPALNRFLDDHMDKTRGDDVYGVHIKDRTSVEWHFPGPDNHMHCVGVNYSNNAWYHLHMELTAAISQEVFDFPLAAREGGEWGLYDNTNDIGTATMTSSLTTGGFDAGEANRYKWWDKVQVNIEKAGAVEVRFGLHSTPTMGETASDEWLDWRPLELDNWIQRESVYLTMHIRSTALNVSWRIGGLSVWGEMAGYVS
jgi:hypothetical protein